MKKYLLVLCCWLATATAAAAAGDADSLAAQAGAFATQAANTVLGKQAGVRVEVILGALDARLKLAPCARIEAYLPPGQRAWGRTRVGLRCVDGASAWNVSMPVTVKVFAPALVATQALPAGTVLDESHLRAESADLAAAGSPAIVNLSVALGRTLGRTLPAGQALHEADLKKRHWFAVGDPVRILAVGAGFSVSGEGVALTPGLEGQAVRVRTESGRIVNGMAVGERRVEVML